MGLKHVIVGQVNAVVANKLDRLWPLAEVIFWLTAHVQRTRLLSVQGEADGAPLQHFECCVLRNSSLKLNFPRL